MTFILTEQEKVIKRKAWLRKNGWTFEKLSRHLDMSRGHAFELIERPHVRPEHVAKLREIDMPEDLLPEARYTRPGPKPGRTRS